MTINRTPAANNPCPMDLMVLLIETLPRLGEAPTHQDCQVLHSSFEASSEPTLIGLDMWRDSNRATADQKAATSEAAHEFSIEIGSWGLRILDDWVSQIGWRVHHNFPTLRAG